jgi:glutathione S-transferase
MKRENRQPPFLAKNPLGGIPVLELDDGTCIAESVAIPLTAQIVKQIAANVAPNRARADWFFELLDGALGKRPFLAGERFSIADISALCAIDFGGALVQVAPSPSLSNLARWHREVSARPSASA